MTKLRVNERGRGGGGGGGGIQNQKQEPHTKMGNKQNTYMIIKYYKSKLPGQVCEVLRDVALVGSWCWSAGGCGGTPLNFGVESSAGECVFPPAFAICCIHTPTHVCRAIGIAMCL